MPVVKDYLTPIAGGMAQLLNMTLEDALIWCSLDVDGSRAAYAFAFVADSDLMYDLTDMQVNPQTSHQPPHVRMIARRIKQ